MNKADEMRAPAVEFEDLSQCRCGGCKSIVEVQNIKTSMNPRTGVRTIKAYCEHCDILWAIDRVLCGLGWRNHSVRIINSRAEKQVFLRSIADVRRETYIDSGN